VVRVYFHRPLHGQIVKDCACKQKALVAEPKYAFSCIDGTNLLRDSDLRLETKRAPDLQFTFRSIPHSIVPKTIYRLCRNEFPTAIRRSHPLVKRKRQIKKQSLKRRRQGQRHGSRSDASALAAVNVDDLLIRASCTAEYIFQSRWCSVAATE